MLIVVAGLWYYVFKFAWSLYKRLKQLGVLNNWFNYRKVRNSGQSLEVY